MIKRGSAILLILLIFITCFGLTSAEETKLTPKSTEVKVLHQLGLVKGDSDDGPTQRYLDSKMLRKQLAIMYLRLRGLLEKAEAYEPRGNFVDVSKNDGLQYNYLGYLYDNPGLGIAGIGGNRFAPKATMTSKQFYKMLMSLMGYTQSVQKDGVQYQGDYEYSNILKFAAKIGFTRVIDKSEITNGDMIIMLYDAISGKKDPDTKQVKFVETKGGNRLVDELVSAGVINRSVLEITPLSVLRNT